MDANWISEQRKKYNARRSEIIMPLKNITLENQASVVSEFNSKGEQLASRVDQLRSDINKSTDPDKKIMLYYELISSVNLLREIQQMKVIVDERAGRLSDKGDFISMIKNEESFYTAQADHLDKKMRELQDAYLQQAQHLALLEINPPNEALQKSNAQELHHVYLSMQELSRMPLAKEYQGISEAMAAQSKNEYSLYSGISALCDKAIVDADNTKNAASKKSTTGLVQNHPVTQEKQILAGNARLFGKASVNGVSKLKQIQANLETKKVEIHQQLAEQKGRTSGKFDVTQYGNLRFESDLVNQALKRVNKTMEIINSPVTSIEYNKAHAATKLAPKMNLSMR